MMFVRKFDLIWIEKELLPGFPCWFEKLLLKSDIPYVVDYDDATFHRYDMHRHWLVRKLLGNKIKWVMKSAAMVVTGNQYLAGYAAAAGAGHVVILPTVVDLNRYPEIDFQERQTFTIGWIGSPDNTSYLSIINEALTEICQKDKRIKVVLVGAGPAEFSFPFELIPWSEDTEAAMVQSFDVGIMPLPDEPWTRGKCGYKLIQYMACSKPVIASRVADKLGIIQPGINGYLADDKSEWTDVVFNLIAHPHLCRELGKKGRKKVEDYYSVQANISKLAGLLQKAAKPR